MLKANLFSWEKVNPKERERAFVAIFIGFIISTPPSNSLTKKIIAMISTDSKKHFLTLNVKGSHRRSSFCFKSSNDQSSKSIKGNGGACSRPFYLRHWMIHQLGGNFRGQTGFDIGWGIVAPWSWFYIFSSLKSAGNGGVSGEINQTPMFCPTSPPPPTTKVWALQKIFRRRREHTIEKVFYLWLANFPVILSWLKQLYRCFLVCSLSLTPNKIIFCVEEHSTIT